MNHFHKVDVWNELPYEVIETGTIMTFEGHVDRYMDGKGLEGYEPNSGMWHSQLFNLVAWRRWTEGPAPMLYSTMTLLFCEVSAWD